MTERQLPVLRRKQSVPEPGSRNLEAFLKERREWWTRFRLGNTIGNLADAHRDAWILESLGGVVWDYTVSDPSNTDVSDYRSYKMMMELEREISF